MKLVIDRLRHDDGQDLVEYALLASLLSVVSILALSLLGGYIRIVFLVLHYMIGSSA